MNGKMGHQKNSIFAQSLKAAARRGVVLDKWGTPLRNDRDAAAGICLNLAPVSILRKLIEIFQFEKIERDTVCN